VRGILDGSGERIQEGLHCLVEVNAVRTPVVGFLLFVPGDSRIATNASSPS